MAKKKNWIAGATKNAHGQFRAKADKAGMSTGAYADAVTSGRVKAGSKTKRQAALARTLMKLGKGKK